MAEATKRTRMTYIPETVEVLEAAYKQFTWFEQKDKEEVARQLNLTVEHVKNWLNNRRQKDIRLGLREPIRQNRKRKAEQAASPAPAKKAKTKKPRKNKRKKPVDEKEAPAPANVTVPSGSPVPIQTIPIGEAVVQVTVDEIFLRPGPSRQIYSPESETENNSDRCYLNIDAEAPAAPNVGDVFRLPLANHIPVAEKHDDSPDQISQNQSRSAVYHHPTVETVAQFTGSMRNTAPTEHINEAHSPSLNFPTPQWSPEVSVNSPTLSFPTPEPSPEVSVNAVTVNFPTPEVSPTVSAYNTEHIYEAHSPTLNFPTPQRSPEVSVNSTTVNFPTPEASPTVSAFNNMTPFSISVPNMRQFTGNQNFNTSYISTNEYAYNGTQNLGAPVPGVPYLPMYPSSSSFIPSSTGFNTVNMNPMQQFVSYEGPMRSNVGYYPVINPEPVAVPESPVSDIADFSNVGFEDAEAYMVNEIRRNVNPAQQFIAQEGPMHSNMGYYPMVNPEPVTVSESPVSDVADFSNVGFEDAEAYMDNEIRALTSNY